MAQLGYVTLGTNDLDAAVAFYDALLGTLGATRFMVTERGVSWSFGPGTTSLSVMKPFDGQPATAGNGVMAAIGLDDREAVRQAWESGLALGARSDGEVGPRGDAGFFAGYLRDLDGNKLCLFCIETPE